MGTRSGTRNGGRGTGTRSVLGTIRARGPIRARGGDPFSSAMCSPRSASDRRRRRDGVVGLVALGQDVGLVDGGDEEEAAGGFGGGEAQPDAPGVAGLEVQGRRGGGQLRVAR